MRKTRLLVLLPLVLGVGSSHLFGQATASGTIQGTVIDMSGAVVVGAQVEVTQKSTGLIRTTSTDQTGNFRFELLPASTYEQQERPP